MSAPRFRIDDIQLYERPVELRLPFRFGAVTVTRAPQAFVHARITLDDGRVGVGAAAELMIPKWFDKRPDVTDEQNVAALRTSLERARAAYVDGATRTAFAHFAGHYDELMQEGRRAQVPDLVTSYGAAEIDKALLDALGHAQGMSFHAMLRTNAVGFDPAALLPEFAGFDAARLLAAAPAASSILLRHTVGMRDPLAGHPRQLDDGLPESLEEAVRAYGLTHFKLKLGGNVDDDIARLTDIAAVLNGSSITYRATLDGNEQYASVDAVGELIARIRATPALAALSRALLFIEQPLPRSVALDQPLERIGLDTVLIIDESDGDIDAFVRARAMGYAGVSSKCCKGVWKALVNHARCVRWNTEARTQRYFMSGEDLTTQAGLAVQQDLALCSALGIGHVERNGHHYVNGFAGQGASEEEQGAFLDAHPALYVRSHGSVRLAVRDGRVDLHDLDVPGFASGAMPAWRTLTELGATRAPAPSPAP